MRWKRTSGQSRQPASLKTLSRFCKQRLRTLPVEGPSYKRCHLQKTFLCPVVPSVPVHICFSYQCGLLKTRLHLLSRVSFTLLHSSSGFCSHHTFECFLAKGTSNSLFKRSSVFYLNFQNLFFLKSEQFKIQIVLLRLAWKRIVPSHHPAVPSYHSPKVFLRSLLVFASLFKYCAYIVTSWLLRLWWHLLTSTVEGKGLALSHRLPAHALLLASTWQCSYFPTFT